MRLGFVPDNWPRVSTACRGFRGELKIRWTNRRRHGQTELGLQYVRDN